MFNYVHTEIHDTARSITLAMEQGLLPLHISIVQRIGRSAPFDIEQPWYSQAFIETSVTCDWFEAIFYGAASAAIFAPTVSTVYKKR
jgi:hypothetical protein